MVSLTKVRGNWVSQLRSCCVRLKIQNSQVAGQYIVLHPANRGRGLAPKFVKQVTDIERKKGNTKFVPGCGAIHRILAMYELI